MRRGRLLSSVILAVVIAACGGDTPPTTPPPVINPPTTIDPPANAKPAIDAIAVQGRRAKQPARFADLKETVDVSATVRDAETPVDELVYQWSATAGTFSGTGRSVTWTAPDTATTPATVTITLKVVENFGHPGQAKIYSHDTTSTVALALHDSAGEVGRMAREFLDKFSQPQTIKDWREVMRDFKASACPRPSSVDEERTDVENHIANFRMNSYEIGGATVALGFGGSCGVPGRLPQPGDGCASVPVTWNSTNVPKNETKTTRGTDYLSAAYSVADARWWLCSSDFIEFGTLGHAFYSDR